MSIRSGINNWLGREPREETTQETKKVEPPRTPEHNREQELKEHAQAAEIFRTVDAIIAQGIGEELRKRNVKPADRLANNQVYREALEAYTGLKSNPIRVAVEKYVRHESDGNQRLMTLLSDDVQKYVTKRLAALELGEPVPHLTVARLYDALKKWSAVVDVNQRPMFDATTVKDTADTITNRVPKPDSSRV